MLFIKRFLVISSIFLLLLIIFICKDRYDDIIIDSDNLGVDIFNFINILDYKFINDVYLKEVVDDEVLLEIYIPRINLRKFVYNIDSSKNFVDYNVELLRESKLDKNLYFFASHSGGGSGSFFDNLVYLENGDNIWINIDGNSLEYIVDNIFYIDKTGYFDVKYGSSGNKLFLITCSLEYIAKQLVVEAKLVYNS